MKALNVIVYIVFAFGFCRMTTAADYQVDIRWIYYQDNSGREISYDFSDANMDQYDTIALPSHAVTVPPSESETTFLWGPGFGQQKAVLNGGVYQMQIPQAIDSVPEIATGSITVDGSAGDWSSIVTYLEDRAGDVLWPWTPGASADVEYVKLAYSIDSSKLYILLKLGATADQGTCYRLFLDKNLNNYVGEVGDYQVDIKYTGLFWDVVSQGWNSDNDWDWYPVVENGIVIVSDKYIEVSVDCTSFELPATVNVYGRTIENVAPPYSTYDSFSSYFGETWGLSSLGANNAAAPAPSEWQFAARISGFSNPGFGDTSDYIHSFGVTLGGGSDELDDLEPKIRTSWVTGHYMGVEYENSLLFEADVRNDLDDANAYEWEWRFEDGNGMIIEGLDPTSTVLDLKVDVTNAGQSVSFYYRLDSNEPGDWQLAVTHILPVGVGPMNGFRVVYPTIYMDTAYSLGHQPLLGYFEPDGDVDIDDLLVLVNQWLQTPSLPSADIAPWPNGDNFVNFLDFAIFADHWLEGTGQ